MSLRCWLACALAAGTLAAVAAPPPVESFVRGPAVHQVSLSPSGLRIAMLTRVESGRDIATVMDVGSKSPPRAVASFANADVRSVSWVNDDRLVLEAFQTGPRIFEGGAGTFAVDHDGANLRQLIAWQSSVEQTGTRIQSRMLPYGWFLHGTLDDGSADVIVEERTVDPHGEVLDTSLSRLNTQSGQIRPLTHGAPTGASDWVLDKSGEVRVARVLRNGRDKLIMREPGTENWTTLEDTAANGRSGLGPVLLESDDQLVVRAYAGRDTLGLYIYNLSRRTLDKEPLAALDRFDVDGVVRDTGTRRAVGVRVTTDQPQGFWFSEKLAAAQKAIDSALPPGRSNTLICSRCENSANLIVRSTSDRQPGEYYLYSPAAGRLTRLTSRRPWIDEKTQGRRSFHWITARDGQALPLVVTHPPGSSDKQALPAVLLVHGGPWLRGVDRNWDAEAQFLASRGYRVIEPDFRASLGYGWKHFNAGWKQWGLAMQDDLADAALWAGQQGLIDPRRVCIYGASYGGYAALMGPIRHPDLYRCAVSFAGVTDIDLMYTSARGDFTEQARRYFMPEVIGDPVADREQLRRTSPLLRVAEIKVPVLLVQGQLDRRVPPEHADRFEAAARAARVPVERVDYNQAGHGWFREEDHADFLRRLEQFLARSLARGDAP